MDVHGYPWIPQIFIDINGCPWIPPISMDIIGDQWTSMDILGYPGTWISVDSIGLDDDDGMDLGGLADSKESEEYIDVEGAEMAA